MLLVVEKSGAIVIFGEAFEGAGFVLLNACVDVAGDAYVEGSSGAAHDVGVAGFHVYSFELGGEKGSKVVVSIDLRGPSTALRFAQNDGFCVL